MILEVNGQPYTFFTSITVNSRIDALCREFSFVSSRTGTSALPFRGGEACRVLDEDDVIATGHIERLDVDYDSGSHRISLQGRDSTGDLVDSSLTSASDFVPPITLKRCAELAIANISAPLRVIDLSGGVSFQSGADLEAPEPGMNAFEFLERLARSKQVLLTSDGSGRVIITRAARAVSNGRLQNIIGADDNNVISASASYDGTGRFRNYEFVSSLNPLALLQAGVTDLVSIVDQKGIATDTAVRRGRQLALQPETALDSGKNKERAEWELNVRKARGRLYSATVQGFRETPGGALWSTNKLVQVADDFVGINGRMLITGVTFSFDEQGGSTTTLTMMPSNAFTLELNEPRTEKVGAGFLE